MMVFAARSAVARGLAAVSLVFIPARIAVAACNALPPAPPGPPGGFKPMTADQVAARVSYRGVFGRMNQAIVAVPDVPPAAGETRTFDVAPPSVAECVKLRGSVDRCRAVAGLASDTRVHAWLVGRATSGGKLEVVDLTATRVPRTPGLITLAPQWSKKLLQASSVQREASGLTAAIVVSTSKTMPSGIDAKSCAEIAKSDEAVVVCIDSLCSGANCETATPTNPALTMLREENDFKRLCRKKSSDPATEPLCELDPGNTNRQLVYYLDSRGDLSAEFSWNGIRGCEDGTGNCGDDKRKPRQLFGSLAIGRFPNLPNPDNRPIRIPGPEFLGSVDPSDSGRPHGKAKRSKPFFDVALDPNRKYELNLFGNVDEAKSTLHLFRRYAVERTCVSHGVEQACLGVKAGVDICACDDGTPPRLCKCTEQPHARYYVCKGSDFEGEPCTRPSHCWDGRTQGTCNGNPKCFDPISGGEGAECTNDLNDGVAGAKTCSQDEFCGKGLFFLGAYAEKKWDYVLGPTSGVCEADDGQNDGKPCAEVGGENCSVCAGYRLQVGPNR